MNTRRCLIHTLFAVATLILAHPGWTTPPGIWPSVGRDFNNSRSAAPQDALSIDAARQMQLLWATALKGPVRLATPTVDADSVYIPTISGTVYRIDRRSGKVIWQRDLGDLIGIPGASSKSTLTIAGNRLLLSVQWRPMLVALNKTNGRLLWKSILHEHPQSTLTQNPLVVGERVYVGVSGMPEEIQSSSYPCCSFRGAVVAVDLKTGHRLWRTYTLPEGYAGASVWSNQLAYDPQRHTLYATTGNLFAMPAADRACVEARKQAHESAASCSPQGVWSDSILALDPRTGAIRWARRLEDYDLFTSQCLHREGKQTRQCGGEDFDFGNGAMLWSVKGHDLVGAGQKSGVFWALDRDSGDVVWQRRLGPGGNTGGMEFGSATDSQRIFAAEANTSWGETHLPDGKVINYASVAAINGDGSLLWHIADPAGPRPPLGCDLSQEECVYEQAKGGLKGPVTVAGDVIYFCSDDALKGPMFALDARTGQTLWRHDTGSSCTSGASVVDGVVYWASGNVLNAFSTPARIAAQWKGRPVPQPVQGTEDLGSIKDAAHTVAQAERGKAVYAQNCAVCHRPNLEGDMHSPTLSGAGFMAHWFGLSAFDLLKKIRTSMPAGAPGSLPVTDYEDVTAFLLSNIGSPAGDQPLRMPPAKKKR
ncbi:MAG: PQQ-binding-like beta-propeller repeat protein [Proteobacteria bacterium]|nr:PQQ-binding-like beta-propeller repeat protein [Pseudomonadota bacterium]HQR04189.1 PQQ-binding-like beta-propeller repeat protein [Rhodocyclaceae bacterium]